MTGSAKYSCLCIPNQQPYLLLGRHKSGLAWGRWQGFKKTIDLAKVPLHNELFNLHVMMLARQAVTKVLPQAVPRKIELMGLIEHHIDRHTSHIIYVYSARGGFLEVRQQPDLELSWVRWDCLPDEVWPDAKNWLPLFMEGRKFILGTHYDSSGNYLQADYIYKVNQMTIRLPKI